MIKIIPCLRKCNHMFCRLNLKESLSRLPMLNLVEKIIRRLGEMSTFPGTGRLLAYLFIESVTSQSAFRIHLILMWIRIRIRILGSTFGKSGSGSSDPPFHNSGSGSSDPHLEKVDPDLDPSTLNIFRL